MFIGERLLVLRSKEVAFLCGCNEGDKMSNRKLKVFGCGIYIGRYRKDKGRGQRRAIVATTSQKKAAEAMGITLYEFRTYGCETGNKKEIEQAMSSPGTVFHCPLDDYRRQEWGVLKEEDKFLRKTTNDKPREDNQL